MAAAAPWPSDGATAAEETRCEALTRIQRDQHQLFGRRPAVCGGSRQRIRAGLHRHQPRTQGGACQAIRRMVRRSDETTARQLEKAQQALPPTSAKRASSPQTSASTTNRAPSMRSPASSPRSRRCVQTPPRGSGRPAPATKTCPRCCRTAHHQPQVRSRPRRSETSGCAIAVGRPTIRVPSKHNPKSDRCASASPSKPSGGL